MKDFLARYSVKAKEAQVDSLGFYLAPFNYAMGQVIIERSDIVATSDSAYVDNGREYMQLSQLPIVTGFGERQFTLVGNVISRIGSLLGQPYLASSKAFSM